MASVLMTRAQELVDQLAAAGITAVRDPAHVSANLPCVLVAPPRVEWAALGGNASAVRWRLLVLGPGLATLAAVEAMAELLEAVSDVLPLESADPGTYQVGQELVACYVATYTDEAL